MSYHSGLESYHKERHEDTHEKLWNALFRMQKGETIVLKDGFKWTKSNWAKEAGVNINTICKKKLDGTFLFDVANESFSEGPGVEPASLKQTRSQIAILQSNEARLYQIIRQRDARIAELEEKLKQSKPNS